MQHHGSDHVSETSLVTTKTHYRAFFYIDEIHLCNVNAVFHALFHVRTPSCCQRFNFFGPSHSAHRCTMWTVLHMLLHMFVLLCSCLQVQFDSVWTSPTAGSFATVEPPFQIFSGQRNCVLDGFVASRWEFALVCGLMSHDEISKQEGTTDTKSGERIDPSWFAIPHC